MVAVSFVGAAEAPSRTELLSWIEKASRAVASYYGGFPVSRVDLTVRVGRPGGIAGGRTWGDRGGARILITLLHAMEKYGQTKGVAALCIGGGEATAVAIERAA